MRECLICFTRVSRDEEKWAQTLLSCDCPKSNPRFHTLCLIKALAKTKMCPLCRSEQTDGVNIVDIEAMEQYAELNNAYAEAQNTRRIKILYAFTGVICTFIYTLIKWNPL